MKYFVNNLSDKNRPLLLQWDRYKYGDLYGLAYLSNFKEFREKLYEDDRIISDTTKAIDLWFIGDSFLGSAIYSHSNPFFLYRSSVKYFYWLDKEPKLISLNGKSKKVLIIESTERGVRERLHSSEFYTGCYKIGLKQEIRPPKSDNKESKLTDFLKRVYDYRIVPASINQNLETILFGYELLQPFKEAKADLNYHYFKRTAPSVYVSKDEKNLFLRATIDTTSKSSSYRYLSKSEVDSLVDNLNKVSEHYKGIGFDEVIFSITPNAATVVNNDNSLVYNNLIPRIQNHPKLKVSMIDVYTRFKNTDNKRTLYWKSDTHWTSNGFRIWVDETNRILMDTLSHLER
jgi:hypothetical protein